MCLSMHYFTLVAGHLTDSLTAAGVGEKTVAQVIAAVAPLADDITSGSPSA